VTVSVSLNTLYHGGSYYESLEPVQMITALRDSKVKRFPMEH